MENQEDGGVLHVVMFPWLAMGHLIPFHHLSTLLASKGHKISFLSTPRNLSRLPKTSPSLSSLINLIPLPFPHLQIQNLPPLSESSMDIPHQQAQLLKIAFDSLETPLARFLESASPKPDWVVYDYASHWLPPLAADLGISAAYFSLFNAANMAFIGPPSMVLEREYARTTAEDFTVVPRWITAPSEIVYRRHEVAKFMESSKGNESGTNDVERFAGSIGRSDVVLFRTCVEFEPDWFDIVCELYNKPVLALGFLPPQLVSNEVGGNDGEWGEIEGWLEKQRVNSVVYVALGTEATLSQDELTALALGLERSRLPFFWVFRKPPGSIRDQLEMLPDGFVNRVMDRGRVYMDWAPQARILSHPAIGGFLTHCGWNSVIEGLSYGRVLILFPVMNDQGLNARMLAGKKLGVEIPRNEWDGTFTSDSVSDSVRLAMESEEGETLRANAREAKFLFGDKYINERYVDSFVRYFVENRPSE
ncbi:hypothetical protein RHMOL_Rhmol06G0088900 [Rhododendron molle]|uniref:Uncharacterized protein n=1 Tax=Rhododendron molle TaxID=49168 RepID=A0ACC0NA95_RHOML|nr:hypothetical protein RHMOL_Rhmol06G0088900 [Rhododendron molle]